MTHQGENQEYQEHQEQIEPVRVNETQESDQELNLGNEFREFGRQLMRAFRSIADGEELRQLSSEVVDTLRDLGEEVQGTVERTRQKEEVRAVGERAKRVGQAVSSGIPAKDVANELQSGLGQALRTLNDELNRLIDQVQTRSARSTEEIEGTAREAGPGFDDQEATVEDVTGDGEITAEDMRADTGMAGTSIGMEQPVREPQAGDESGATGATASDTNDAAGAAAFTGSEPRPEATRSTFQADTGGVATMDNVDDDEPIDDRPLYMGDKVDAAVERLEDNGGPMSDAAEALLAEGRAELDALVDEQVEEDEDGGGR